MSGVFDTSIIDRTLIGACNEDDKGVPKVYLPNEGDQRMVSRRQGQPDPNKVRVGRMLRARREFLSLRQGDLAGLGGPGEPTVARYENGKQGDTPRPDTHAKFEIALKL